MIIPERDKQEGLIEYAERLSLLHANVIDNKKRKLKGQFFTPKKVSKFMASLFEIHHNTIHLLDPGAGTGVLTAAFCERLLENGKMVDLSIDAYENDPNLLPLLKKTLEICKTELKEKGNNVEYNIYNHDFILYNKGYIKRTNLLWKCKENSKYNFVISNPPYYKLKKNSPQSRVMIELISGQPNIYALFMALSASMVKDRGEIVFITPRSFCSGLYYKKFREWFLKNTQIENIHIFESRKEIFNRDGVLQENIIIRAKKFKNPKQEKLIISSSKNKDFNKLKKIKVKPADAVYRNNEEVFIRIPSSSLDMKILHIVDAWPNILKDFGLKISTGPVVPFRAKQYLLSDLNKSSKSVPLLWMHNMQEMRVVWPLKINKKEYAIKVCDKSMSLLLPVNNYILVKRFSSKEQKRRLYASILLKSEFPYKTVGIENHVNYIYRPNNKLSIYEAYGITAILNTSFIDNYFRSVNGNTQVNATDIRNLPFPKIKDIIKIGRSVYESKCLKPGFELDKIVAKILGINTKIIKSLNKDKTKK